MNWFGFAIVFGFLSVLAGTPGWIPATDARVQVQGRASAGADGELWADWPGTRLVVRFRGDALMVSLGGDHRWEASVDGESRPIITVKNSGIFMPAQKLPYGEHTLVLARRTEAAGQTARIIGFMPLGDSADLLEPPPSPVRRLEFIGDSYTVGYGNESDVQTPREEEADSLVFMTTNTQASFAMLVARRLGAEAQINAISGRGLARNYNGFAPGQEFGVLYPYSLIGAGARQETQKRWDFGSWHPQVIVIGLGINDWQGKAPYPEGAQFRKAYAQLLDSLRLAHPGVKFVLCATQVWPTEALIPEVKKLIEEQKALGHKDLVYFEYSAERNALWNHPSVRDHQAIAAKLIPVVTELGGWRSR